MLGAPGDPAAGELLAGRYVIERVLGRGGMGIVLAAQDRQTRTRVAVKLMHAQDARNATSVERFFREARAASRLSGPHVLKMIDVARLPDGRPYLVTEFLQGRDLGIVLRERKTLPIADAARFAMQAANACSAAHAAGVVHRDLKPSNLFVTKREGQESVKLLDFGISKLSGLSGTAHHNLTAQGDVSGTPLYMPPEQLRAQEVDGRVDIWAIGATLYEMLTGKRPFAAESMMVECNRILMENPAPPSQMRRDVPPGLDAIVLRCLEKKADQRFATADQLAAALAPFATKRRSIWPFVIVALLLFAALGAGGVVVLRRQPSWLPSVLTHAPWAP